MRRHHDALCVLIGCLLLISSSIAQDDISIDEVKVGNLNWGEGTIGVSVTNSSDYLRFLVVETDVIIDGPYLTPNRRTVSNYYILPEEAKEVQATVNIPPTYGTGRLHVLIHDVVDTLDAVLPDQTIYNESFEVSFPVPDDMKPYLERPIDLPPRVEEHPYYDTEFSRILFILLDEGKSADEIARITGSDSAFVATILGRMVDETYLVANAETGQLEPIFPVIRLDEVKATMPLADSVTGVLVEKYRENLPLLRSTIDSLIAAGAMGADSNDFLNGGGVLFREYPTITGLSLWYDLANQFITRSAPLLLYDGTDPCNAHIPFYMYAVEGGPEYNGTHFFYLTHNRRNITIYFGDTQPNLVCDPHFIRKREQNLRVNWSHARSEFPEIFSLDTAVVRPAVEKLTPGSDSLLHVTYYSLKDIALKYGHPKVSFGHRYWFWNLVATRTVERLVNEGVLERRGNGQFRFDGFQVPGRN